MSGTTTTRFDYGQRIEREMHGVRDTVRPGKRTHVHNASVADAIVDAELAVDRFDLVVHGSAGVATYYMISKRVTHPEHRKSRTL